MQMIYVDLGILNSVSAISLSRGFLSLAPVLLCFGCDIEEAKNRVLMQIVGSAIRFPTTWTEEVAFANLSFLLNL